MNISFIVPAYNEEKYIGPCLESIFAHTGEEVQEILVINNASTDRTAEVAGKFPKVRVVHEPKKGLTFARERGLREAQGEFLAYIDADTRLHAGWLPIVKEEFSKRNDLVCLSGPFSYYDLTPSQKFAAEMGWKIFAPLTYAIVGYMVLGANFIVRKDALLQAGTFNTSVAFYGEDTDIARRLSKVGTVLFRMNFFILGSGRRLLAEGLLKTYATYAANFISEVAWHKPVTKRYKDIR
ncbi:MAG: glycosyltransferase family 2 protein [Candidatus Liptonbacteria bacterium]|nr:glycosyltransferase family 2 protein [Candidatus Liptonbacteria bacterium]